MSSPLALASGFRSMVGRASSSLARRPYATPIVALACGALLLVALQLLSHQTDYRSVIRQLRHLPLGAWMLAVGATLVSFLALIGGDAHGLRRIGARVPSLALFAGATAGAALGNTIGRGALTGGKVRARIYGVAHVEATQAERLARKSTQSLDRARVLLSVIGLLGAACSPFASHHGAHALALDEVFSALLPLAIFTGCAVLAGGMLFKPQWRRVTAMPIGAAPARTALAAIDVLASGFAFWVFLPHTHLNFGAFIAIFATSSLLGSLARLPAGLGVFDVAILSGLAGSVTLFDAAAALIAWRAIYSGAPLVLSAGLLAAFERHALRERLPLAQAARVSQLAPSFLGVLTFVTGGMLVMSGATPAFLARIAILQSVLPLWVMESSQLLCGMLGVMLLFVANGLMKRLDAAWWLTLIIASASLALSLAKGLAFVEASVLATLIGLLFATRHRFHRRASLFAVRFTASWLISVAMVLMLTVWMMFFAFRDIPYSNELWWQFAFDERAPRALRATLAAALLAASFGFWQLLRPAPGRFVKPAGQDLADANQIIRAQERSDAGLALMGDKSFLFSQSRRSFLMYAKHGRTWAALHDPVGPRDEWKELISAFVEMAHAHGGRAAFYQVRANALPLYLDAGLSLMKLGEEANIALDEFSLKGPQRAHLRYALKRGERDGFTTEVIAAADVPAALPMLRTISDAWLASRSAREKSFSVAAFNDAYLAAQSVLVVRQNGAPIAFVTFMTTDLNTEATVGVMRHIPETSGYAMEYLFTQLALHLKDAGFRSLSLGIAPLSGMQPMPLASRWHRVAGLVWRFGGRFYNFRGLRAFKSKFQPQWEPRYLAASGSLGVCFTLADLSLLAGGQRS